MTDVHAHDKTVQEDAKRRIAEGKFENSAEEFRLYILRRGCNGIKQLGRKFRIADDDNNYRIDKEEFQEYVNDMGMRGWSREKTEKLFAEFDVDNNGWLNYDEFLGAIRPAMSDCRERLVKKAFFRIAMVDNAGEQDADRKEPKQTHIGPEWEIIHDKGRKGFQEHREKIEGCYQKLLDNDDPNKYIITVEDLTKIYNASNHPKISSGQMNEDQVMLELLKHIDVAGQKGKDAKLDDKVTWEEFKNYFSGISASIDDDAYFTLMMWNSWGVGDYKTVYGFKGHK